MKLNEGDPILVIKPFWLQKILDGSKHIEIRSSRCNKAINTRIFLSESGTSKISASAVVVRCVGPLTCTEFNNLKSSHCILSDSLPYKKTYAWVLKDVFVLPNAINYKVKPGAIVWRKYIPISSETDM